jgi:hypothetical protein
VCADDWVTVLTETTPAASPRARVLITNVDGQGLDETAPARLDEATLARTNLTNVIFRRLENAWPRRPRGLRDGSRNRKVPNDMVAGLNMERQNLDSFSE